MSVRLSVPSVVYVPTPVVFTSQAAVTAVVAQSDDSTDDDGSIQPSAPVVDPRISAEALSMIQAAVMGAQESLRAVESSAPLDVIVVSARASPSSTRDVVDGGASSSSGLKRKPTAVDVGSPAAKKSSPTMASSTANITDAATTGKPTPKNKTDPKSVPSVESTSGADASTSASSGRAASDKATTPIRKTPGRDKSNPKLHHPDPCSRAESSSQSSTTNKSAMEDHVDPKTASVDTTTTSQSSKSTSSADKVATTSKSDKSATSKGRDAADARPTLSSSSRAGVDDREKASSAADRSMTPTPSGAKGKQPMKKSAKPPTTDSRYDPATGLRLHQKERQPAVDIIISAPDTDEDVSRGRVKSAVKSVSRKSGEKSRESGSRDSRRSPRRDDHGKARDDRRRSPAPSSSMNIPEADRAAVQRLLEERSRRSKR